MRAYLEENANRDSKTALQFYRSILSVLEWGLKTWKDVPNSERGAVFTETFIRGIRKHYLNAYLSVRSFQLTLSSRSLIVASFRPAEKWASALCQVWIVKSLTD